MYPIMLDVAKLSVLVVGGGKIGTRKVRGLIDAGAKPVVVAPTISQELQAFQAAAQISWLAREFNVGDTRQHNLVFICTNDSQVNQAVLAETTPDQLVNDTTHKAHSNFFNMGVIHREEYDVAVTTWGTNPRKTRQLTEKIRQQLNRGQL
jgi:precorrin-2 dehydrogenase/sirohydrochlorin ferrochelatase